MKKVLIVEDEKDVAFVIQSALEETGYQAVVALDGALGLEMAGTEKPDLILLDIMIPKIDGYALNVKLKQDPSTHGIPVIVMTGHGHMKELFSLNKEAPVQDFLEKPFPIDTLLEKIAKWIVNI